MKKVTNLIEYADKANLELCLTLIEEAYESFQAGAHDLAEAQIMDILDIFERDTASSPNDGYMNNVLPFRKVEKS